jgi:glutamyl-tRNA reductase
VRIFVLGINHKTAPLDLRERFLITREREDAFGRLLAPCGAIAEKAVLSTCNRTEIYGVARDPEAARGALLGALGAWANLGEAEYRDRFYFKTEPESVDHLFTVASGLDSLALGETEILGQVKEAYLRAHGGGSTGRVLNTLFQKSLRVAKEVRTRTRIGAGKVSVASIAVDLATKIFADLASKHILVVGSGEVAAMVCKSLAERGVARFIIANRNRERAAELVRRYGGAQIAYEDIDAWMPETDILVASAAAPHAIVTRERVADWMKRKHGRSLFAIDLGVPRNVEPSAGEIGDVYLYNVDDLKAIAGRNIAARERAVEDGKRLIARQAALFMERFEALKTRSCRGAALTPEINSDIVTPPHFYGSEGPVGLPGGKEKCGGVNPAGWRGAPA